MKPTIGRIVNYTQPSHELPHNGTRTHPAMITAVFSDICVNLKVFFDLGSVENRSSQQRRDSFTADVAEKYGYWDWPSLRVEPI